MLLDLPVTVLDSYKSASQRARVATEAWGAANLYCPNCDSPSLTRSRVNMPAIDYSCPRCHAGFQLKAQSRAFAGRVVDAAYDAMRRAIEQDRTPNLLALHYVLQRWQVWSLVLVPHFAFSLSALEKRKPLGPLARRCGWTGCNIVLANIPQDARIFLVRDGRPSSPKAVREQYARLRPLAALPQKNRGWTLDTLNAVRSLGKEKFSLKEAYSLEARLAELHPSNRHVRDKIRQQLQVLRDMGIVEFVGRGNYRLRSGGVSR